MINHIFLLYTDDERNKELVYFFGDSVLQSRTNSQPGSTNIFTGVTADWNVARSLCIQSCIDKVRPVRFGEHLVSFANMYISNSYIIIISNIYSVELEVTAYSSGYCLVLVVLIR